MYIGKHKHEGFDPDYYGSGILLERAVNKYGKENFSVSVIEYFDTEEEAYDYEYELISLLNAVEDPRYYNISPGGNGFREGDMSTRGTIWMNNGEDQARVPEDRIPEYESNGYVPGSLNRHLSGRIRVTNGTREHLIYPEELDSWLSIGWYRGRCESWSSNNKGYVFIERNGHRTRVPSDKLEDYLSDGWVRITFIPPNHEGDIYIHKNGKDKLIPESLIQSFLSDGWELGKSGSTTKGRKWVHKLDENGQVIRKMVKLDEYKSVLEEGWLPGSAMKMAGIPRPRGRNHFVSKGDESKYIPSDKLELYLSNGWKLVN